jgi:hypothetical protein
VWETGVSYSLQPQPCSGVYVDDAFKETDTEVGTYAHYIDFPRGRAVFDTAISTSADVRADYAFRIPTISDSKKPWLQELLYGSLNVGRSDWNVPGSGSHNQLAETRRQMPTIGIGLSRRQNYQPYEVGSLTQWVNQDMLVYILSENKGDRDRLLDIFANQNDRVIWLPDRGLMKENSQYPVDIDVEGKPVTNPMQYPEIVAPTGDGGFRWSSIQLKNAQSQAMETVSDGLYRGVVRFTCQAIF